MIFISQQFPDHLPMSLMGKPHNNCAIYVWPIRDARHYVTGWTNERGEYFSFCANPSVGKE